MSRFRYRLATLMRLREAARDEKRAHLAAAFRAAQILAERLHDVDTELAATRSLAAQGARTGAIDVDQCMQTHRYERILRGERAVIVGQQQQIAAEIERRRLALVEADRQVRVLEKLREKKLAEHQQRQERSEQKLMDELAGRIAQNAQEAGS